MEVQVWADFHCPYCYIGIERLKRAMAELNIDGKITLRSYLLNPDADPGEDMLIPEYVARAYGSKMENVRRNNALIERRGKALGLQMDLEKARFTGMIPAHRVLQYLKTLGLGQLFFEKAQKALFEEGELLSDPETLLRLAEEAGASREEVGKVLGSEQYKEEVFADYREAREMNIDFVPYYLFEGGEAMSGERTLEEYLGALRRAAEKERSQ